MVVISDENVQAEKIWKMCKGLLKVSVQPNKRETRIIAWDPKENVLEVEVAAPPDKDKANLELLRFLRKFFGKPVILVRGAKGREKYVRIR